MVHQLLKFHLKVARIISAHILLPRASYIPLNNFKGEQELQLQSCPVPKKSRTKIFVDIPHDCHGLVMGVGVGES